MRFLETLFVYLRLINFRYVRGYVEYFVVTWNIL